MGNNHEKIINNNSNDEKKFFDKLIAEFNDFVQADPSYGVEAIYEDPDNRDYIIIQKNNGDTVHIPKRDKISFIINDEDPIRVDVEKVIQAELEKIKSAGKDAGKSEAA